MRFFSFFLDSIQSKKESADECGLSCTSGCASTCEIYCGSTCENNCGTDCYYNCSTDSTSGVGGGGGELPCYSCGVTCTYSCNTWVALASK